MIHSVSAACWSCGKEWNIMYVKLPITGKGKRCDCGGYVITPSGKMKTRLITAKEDGEKLPKLY